MWEKTTSFFSNTFGAGVVQAQDYKAIELKTSILGWESGTSTSKVIAGNIEKPISFYAVNASKWWKLNEYKIGVQVNICNGGYNYAFNPLETTAAISAKNTSFEIVHGINKIGATISTKDRGRFCVLTKIKLSVGFLTDSFFNIMDPNAHVYAVAHTGATLRVI